MANTTYAIPEELRARGGVPASDAGDDALLQALLNTAAQIVDKQTRKPPEGIEAFSATSGGTVRTFDDILSEDGLLTVDDCLSVSALTRGATQISAGYYKLYPYNPGVGPYTHILLRGDTVFNTLALLTPSTWYNYPFGQVGAGQIVITGVWGYCTAGNRPPVIKEATLKIARKLYYESTARESELAQALIDPSALVDKQIARLLEPYRRRTFFA